SLSDHSAISCLAEKLGIRKSICAPYRAQLQCSVSESVLGMAAVIQWRGGERTAADLVGADSEQIGHACHILGLGLAAPASIRKTCALHPNDHLPYTHGVRHAWQRAPSHHCTTDAYGTTGEEKKVL